MTLRSRLQHAVDLHGKGDLAAARQAYQAILALTPDFLDALHYLGALEYQAGNYQAALSVIERGLRLAPQAAPLHFNAALSHLALGSLSEALFSFERCITNDPRHQQAYFQAGNVLVSMGRLEDALARFDQALDVGQEFAALHNHRGNVLLDLTRPSEALNAYERAIALTPNDPSGHNNLGNALRDLSRLTEAIESYSRAIRLNPQHVDALNNRGNVWLQLRKLDRAQQDYDSALRIAPHYAPTYRNIASIHTQCEQHDKALHFFELSLQLNPNDALTHCLQGEAFRELGQVAQASESFDRAMVLNPRLENVLGLSIQARVNVCNWEGLSSGLQAIEAEVLKGYRVCAPFNSLGLFDRPDLHFAVAQTYSRSHCPASSALGPIESRAANARVKIGYFSADFHSHATSYLMAQLFELHDRERFEIFAFSYGPDTQDEMRARLVRAFDHFIDVRDLSDIETAAQSRQLNIDIAIDVKGYCKDSRTAIFAHRCAPVQVNYLAYPGTLATDFMDYIIADRIVLPPDQHRFYSESVAYLPHNYLSSDSTTSISPRVFSRDELGLPPKGFVFCSFNNNYKILPETFDIWMRILEQVDGSVLWLFKSSDPVVQNLRKEAVARGVSAERLIFSPFAPMADHLSRIRCADLCLDTLPYNAHTTTSNALWAGLPVLTLMGRAFAGRVAASLLTAVGLPELITHSATEYESLAIELAQNQALLADVRAKLAQQRDTHPLFDTPLLCQNLEAIYLEMQRRQDQGIAPSPIDLWPQD